MKKIIAGILSLSLCAFANAQISNLAGATFSSSGKTNKQIAMFVILLDDEKGVIATETTFMAGECTGFESGIGQLTKNRLVFSPYVTYDANGTRQAVKKEPSCQITVDFDKTFESGKITENAFCAPYHNGTCSLNGDLVKRNK